MKRFSLCALISIILCSCSKDFLDKKPISNISTDNFYQTSADITTAVNGAYSALKLSGQYFSYYIFTEISSDNTKNFPSGSDFGVFTLSPTNASIAAAWADNYTGIYRCNIILSKIANVSMDATLKARYIGEIKFLRALMYFNLVRYFGPIPLVLKEINSPNEGYDFVRSPVADVYSQIITDLNDADSALPISYSGADIGRVTKGAAKSLLGKVYLTKRDFPSAVSKLKEVINLNTYSLLPNYVDVFKAANKNGSETVFSVQYKTGLGGQTGAGYNGQGSPFSNFFAPPGSGPYVSISTPVGSLTVSDDLINSYETGDLRKAASVATSYIGAGGAVVNSSAYSKKFPDGSPAIQYDSDDNWPVIRYADVLLMYSEALNEVSYQAGGDAFTYLNIIRNRAGLPSKSSTDLPDQLSFRLAMEQERRSELALEGHRWFDLLRTNRALTVINSKSAALGIIGNDNSHQIDAHNLLFPIPQDQVRISNGKITQNPGYPN